MKNVEIIQQLTVYIPNYISYSKKFLFYSFLFLSILKDANYFLISLFFVVKTQTKLKSKKKPKKKERDFLNVFIGKLYASEYGLGRLIGVSIFWQ